MRSTLQDQLDAIEKHLNKNFIEITGETMDDRLTEEEIEAVIQTVFEYASQFRESSTQGGEETDWHLAFRSISQSHIKQANRIRVLEEALKRVLNINGIARGHISEEFFQSIEQALNPKD